MAFIKSCSDSRKNLLVLLTNFQDKCLMFLFCSLSVEDLSKTYAFALWAPAGIKIGTGT
jgi:hypothetical protein